MSAQTSRQPRLRIVYVDDESRSLKYFEKAFSAVFEIHTASGADEGWQIIERHGGDVAILVTDQRMPGRSGVDLLSQVRNAHPQIVRILTTAYSDLDSAIAAVNEGAIHRYVVKPWNLAEFEGILAQAAEFHIIRRERDKLLAEKLGMLQRLMLMDRVKALCIVAAALAPRFQGALRAAAAYLDAFPGAETDLYQPSFGSAPHDLQELTRKENRHLLEAVRSVAQGACVPVGGFKEGIDIGAVAAQAARDALRGAVGAKPDIENGLSGDLPLVTGDRDAIERALLSVCGALLSLGAEGPLRIEGAADDGAGVVLRIGVRGVADAAGINASFALLKRTAAPDAPAGVFLAFLVVHHHGGSLRLLPSESRSCTFEMRLPIRPRAEADTPEDADRVIASLLARIEEWEIARL